MTRARIYGSMATWLAMLSAATFAQTDSATLGALRACAGIEPDAARLACFDAELAREPEPTPAAAVDVRAAPASPPPAAAPQTTATTSTAPVTSSARATPVAPAALPVAAAPVVPDTNAAATPPAESSNRDDAGQSEAEALDGEAIVVVGVSMPRPGDTRFLTQDGRAFVQTSGTTRRHYPEVPFDALLQGGALGGLFLKVAPDGPRVRVVLRE